MFNSTSPRFNYDKAESIMKEVPGPGSYDSTQHKTFNLSDNTTSQFDKTYSIFKDQTTRMDDLKGYRGYQRHQNVRGPGQYTPKQPFLRKTFNTTLPLGNFV